MKNLRVKYWYYILILISLFYGMTSFGQLPYSWTPGVDPNWTSSNPGSGNALDFLVGCDGGVVTTNCTGNYSNNQNTTYTSHIIDANCNNASTLNISFFVSGNAEYEYDFLFIEYLIDGGVSYINPYGVNIGWTGNFGTGSTVSIIAPTSTTFRFRFTFISDGSVVRTGYKISNFTISCNVQLPIELKEFTGVYNGDNYLSWTTATELNNDYFTLEHSIDGENWKVINIQPGSGTTNNEQTYSYIHRDYEPVMNYYRLSQTDYNGTTEIFHNKIIVIDNTNTRYPVKYINPSGQEISIDNIIGVYFIIYSDGTVKKSIK